MFKRYVIALLITIMSIIVPTFICHYVVENSMVEDITLEGGEPNINTAGVEYDYGRSIIKSINFSDETYITLSDNRVIKTKSIISAKKGDMVEFYKYNKDDEFYIVKLYRELPSMK